LPSNTKFCLDTSCLIEANNRFYAFDILPRFWDLILECCDEGIILIPEVVYEEIKEYQGKDELLEWAKEHKDILFKNMSSDVFDVNGDISNYVYEHYKEDKAKQFLKNGDPLIIAYAKVNGLVLITHEKHINLSHSLDKRDGKFTSEVKIPNICEKFNVKYKNLFDMLRDLKNFYNKSL